MMRTRWGFRETGRVGLAALVVAFGLHRASGEGAMQKAPTGWRPLPGHVTGILVRDAARVMSERGAAGPADAYGFASGPGGYRWVYVPCPGADFQDSADAVTLPVGLSGSDTKAFERVCLLDARLAAHLDKQLTRPYTLVEVEVNGRLGCPVTDTFVATKLRVLNGVLDATRAVEESRKQFLARVGEAQAKGEVARVFGEWAAKLPAAERPSEPRKGPEQVRVSWLPERKTLRAEWRLEYRAPGGRSEASIGIQAKPPGGPRQAAGRRPAEEYCVSVTMAFEFAEGNGLTKVKPFAIHTEVRRAARAK
jgi:hypothetical protein